MVVVIAEDKAESQSILPTTENTNHDRKNSCSNNNNPAGHGIEIKTTKEGLDLLATGIGMRNVKLLQQCTENLDVLLDKKNALSILLHLSKYTKRAESSHVPSAPSNNENDAKTETWLHELTNNLRHNCLLEIDKHADYVLEQKEILQLAKEDLRDILERDTLQVENEAAVYTTITRYCRNNNNQNGDLFDYLYHLPRYGLMSKKQFKSKKINGEPGPTLLLHEKDWRKILFFIEETQKNHTVDGLPFKWSTPRRAGNESPKILSRMSLTRGGDFDAKNKRKSLTTKEKNNCEKLLLNFLTCWSTVFD